MIRRLSRENPLWGAPHIHGELLKLGIDVGESRSASIWSAAENHLHKPGERSWRTTLQSLASVDFFIVPTIRFQILYVFLVLAHERRRIVHFAVTAHPTAEWMAQEMREALPWETAPGYLLRDSRSDLWP